MIKIWWLAKGKEDKRLHFEGVTLSHKYCERIVDASWAPCHLPCLNTPIYPPQNDTWMLESKNSMVEKNKRAILMTISVEER